MARTSFLIRAPLIGILFAVFLFGCSGTNEGVGVSVGNPTGTVPQNNLMPDFDAALPELALGEDTTDDPALVRFTTTDSIGKLYRLLTQGGIESGRAYRASLQSFGEVLAQALYADNIVTAGDDLATVAVDFDLFGQNSDWTVELALERTDSNYFRLYMIDRSSGLLNGTYVFTVNDAGEPVKGILAYVDPARLVESTGSGVRMIAMAFDFSEATQNRIVMRVDEYSENFSANYVFHLHYECNTTTNICIGEYIDISPEGENRTFGTALRYQWNDNTQVICLAEATYSGSTASLGDTFTVTGVSEEGSQTTCEIGTPVWGGHAYITQDLPLRFTDSEPQGGTALEYYIDGSQKSGWNALDPTVIDGWLNASGF